MGWSGLAGPLTVTAVEQVGDAIGVAFGNTYFDERTHDDANHVFQESRSFHVDQDSCSGGAHGTAV